MLLSKKAKEVFGVKPLTSDELYAFLQRCVEIYKGKPEWVNGDDHIFTINFAEAVCSEIARLATMNIDIMLSGSARANWLQDQVDELILPTLRQTVEYGCAFGTIILKPNGESIDLVFPDRFRIVKSRAGEITGIVFIDQKHDLIEDRWYTRLEYHDIENGVYTIQNRYFVGSSKHDDGRPVAVEATPWAAEALADDVIVEGADRLLFGMFRTPRANNVEFDSPLGLPVFSSAIRELKDLDIAYSRNAKEIKDSKRLVLLDSDRLFAFGGVTNQLNKDALVESAGLPDYVKAVEGTGSVEHEIYHEINPDLNTEMRLKGIDALLSQIGFKCGFSNGYFVFNEKTGMITATQVESDDRRTIQLIADIRKALQTCLDDLIYAMDRFADAYGISPRGTYEVAFDFEDVTQNVEEDKARWYSYVTAGQVPFWYYLMKFEGYTEEDAKELVAAAQTPESLYADEE